MRARTLEEYCHQANKLHGNKFQYLYLTTENGFRKIHLICPIHGKFEQLADTHLQERGCKQCGIIEAHKKQKQTLDYYVTKAETLFGNEYKYIEFIPQNKRQNIPRKIKYLCKVHGEIIQVADNHLKGWGCNQCGYDQASEKLSDSFETVVAKVKLIHGNRYKYVRLFKKSKQRVLEIMCQIHGTFLQIVSDHLSGSGCPKCAYTNSSLRENKWLDSIGILKENRQIMLPSLGKIKVDGYNPKTNTVYEFYGDFWHGNPSIYQSEKINPKNGKTFGYLYNQTITRENRIKLHYNLQTIWENDWLRLMEINKI